MTSMKSTREIALEAMRRSGHIRRDRQRRQSLFVSGGAGIVSLALILMAGLTMPASIGTLPDTTQLSNSLGAMFVQSTSLGYIIIGLISFVLGICVALLSVYLHRRNVRDKGSDVQR